MNRLDSFSSGSSAEADPALSSLLRAAYAPPADAGYWGGLEQRVTMHVQDSQLLQLAYAAPADANYWNTLEQRVLTHVRNNGPLHWWAVLPQWRSAGMVAAAAALFLVGASTVLEQQREAVAREHAAMAAEARIIDASIEPINMAIMQTSPNKGVGTTTPERYIDLIRP